MENSSTIVKNKKPFAFYLMSMVFTFERFTYYGVRVVLALYIAGAITKGGLGLGDDAGTSAITFLSAFTYLAPVFGGYIADRWIGAKKLIVIGLIIMTIGYFVLWAFPSNFGVYGMIFLVAIGTGLFKGNLTGIIGRLFQNQDELDSAFSVYYSFVNVGSFLGTTVLGILYETTFKNGEVFGYRPALLAKQSKQLVLIPP